MGRQVKKKIEVARSKWRSDPSLRSQGGGRRRGERPGRFLRSSMRWCRELVAFASLLQLTAGLVVDGTNDTSIELDRSRLNAIRSSDRAAFVMVEPSPGCPVCMVLHGIWAQLGQEFPGRLWHVSCAGAGAMVCVEIVFGSGASVAEGIDPNNPTFFTWNGTFFEEYAGNKNPEALVAHVRDTALRLDSPTEVDEEQEAAKNVSQSLHSSHLIELMKRGDALGHSLIHDAQGSVLLKGFNRIPSISVSAALSHQMVPSKRDYFDFLRTGLGYKSGVQTEERGGLCLEADGDARLLDASCLISRGFRWIVFVGDSLVREQAASFFRHTLVDQISCQPWAEGASLDSKSLNQTHVNCSVLDTQVTSCPRTICPTNATGGPPCEAFHSTYIIMYARPSEMTVAIENLTAWVAAHPCPGIVVTSGNDLHFLWLERNSNFPAKSSRTRAWIRRFYDVVKNGHAESILVWGSTPKPNIAIMNLPPPKADVHWWKAPLNDFGQIALLDVWYQTELQLFATRNSSGIPDDVVYLPVYDLYDKYSGLMCDGLHTGAFPIRQWGCDGFLVVTDMLIQVLLNRICLGTVVRVA